MIGRPQPERHAPDDRRCYTGAVHDVLRMMGHDNIVLPPDDQGDRAGHAARRAGVDGVGPHRPHEVAPRDASRLVHAARESARPATSSSASPTTTKSR